MTEIFPNLEIAYGEIFLAIGAMLLLMVGVFKKDSVNLVSWLAVGFIVTVVSMFFTKLQVHHLGVTVGIVLMTSILFSLMGFVNAVYANSFDDISIVPTFVLTPLTYLGGVFYSISLLPEFWQGVSKLNPVLYMVNAFRYGILGTSDISVGLAFTGVGAFIVVLFIYCMHLLKTGKRLRA